MSGEPRPARSPRILHVYEEQVAAFRQKFGREMGPKDPFFFDPDAESPQFQSPENAGRALERLAVMLAQAGMAPEHVYAFRKTGGLFPDPRRPLTPRQQTEWDKAVTDYRAKVLRGETPE
jgi:hypothetical protein